MRSIKTTATILLCLSAAGCASYLRKDPYIDEAWTAWRHEPADPIALVNAAYVAREMVPSSDRQILAAKVRQAQLSADKVKSHAEWGAGALAAQAINGNPFSTGGVHTASHVAVGLQVIGALIPDGSSSAVSGIVFPKVWNGGDLDKASALTAAWAYTEDKAMAGASAIDYELTCYLTCSSPVKRTYLLTKKKPHPAWRVDPDYMVLVATMPKGGMTKIEKQDAVMSTALGFDPAWFTGPGNRAPLELNEVVKGPDGKPELLVPDHIETIRTRSWDLRKSKLGHFFLKAFYSDRYAYLGMTENTVRQVVYNGVIYPFKNTTGKDFLTDTLADDFVDEK